MTRPLARMARLQLVPPPLTMRHGADLSTARHNAHSAHATSHWGPLTCLSAVQTQQLPYVVRLSSPNYLTSSATLRHAFLVRSRGPLARTRGTYRLRMILTTGLERRTMPATRRSQLQTGPPAMVPGFSSTRLRPLRGLHLLSPTLPLPLGTALHALSPQNSTDLASRLTAGEGSPTGGSAGLAPAPMVFFPFGSPRSTPSTPAIGLTRLLFLRIRRALSLAVQLLARACSPVCCSV